jgi:hypothetical protein
VVDIDKVWPYMIPACEEHDLCGDTGRHKAVLELGAGAQCFCCAVLYQPYRDRVVLIVT